MMARAGKWCALLALAACGRQEEPRGWRVDDTLGNVLHAIERASGEKFEVDSQVASKRIRGVISATRPLAQAHEATRLHGEARLVFDPSNETILVVPGNPPSKVYSDGPYFFTLASSGQGRHTVIAAWETASRPMMVKVGQAEWERVIGTTDKARTIVSGETHGAIEVIESTSEIEVAGRAGMTTLVSEYEVRIEKPSVAGGRAAVLVWIKGAFSGPEFQRVPPHVRVHAATIGGAPAHTARAHSGPDRAMVELVTLESPTDPERVTFRFVTAVRERRIPYSFPD